MTLYSESAFRDRCAQHVYNPPLLYRAPLHMFVSSLSLIPILLSTPKEMNFKHSLYSYNSLYVSSSRNEIPLSKTSIYLLVTNGTISQIYYKIIELFLQLVRLYKHLSGFTVSLSMHSTVVIEIDHYPSWVELS